MVRGRGEEGGREGKRREGVEDDGGREGGGDGGDVVGEGNGIVWRGDCEDVNGEWRL